MVMIELGLYVTQKPDFHGIIPGSVQHMTFSTAAFGGPMFRTRSGRTVSVQAIETYGEKKCNSTHS
jgi:hypothetical protein